MRIGKRGLSVALLLGAILSAATGGTGGAGAATDAAGLPAASPVTGVSGSAAANGLTIYKYLRSHGFTPMAAGQATALRKHASASCRSPLATKNSPRCNCPPG